MTLTPPPNPSPLKTITVAAAQMDGQSAPTTNRLRRAGALVAKSAQSGAQLVVLPELFNLGYTYSDDNYHRAEPLTGPTGQWLGQTAARHNLHLAGSILLREGSDIYNSLLLCAPDGRLWRYDKQYPWAWERGYFTAGINGITIAHTNLGTIGFLICWDTAHRQLWRQYAGQVDLMLISSCPPDVSNPTYHLPGGPTLTVANLGPVMASFKDGGHQLFVKMVSQQTAWLSVPAVHAVAMGHCRTGIPNGVASLAALLPTAPWLARYLPQAKKMELSCDFVPACRVIDAQGQQVGAPPAGREGVALATVELAGSRPHPLGPQPASPLPWASYLFSDIIQPWLMAAHYRRKLGQLWETTPTTHSHRPKWRWLTVTLLFSLAMMLLLRRRLVR